MGQTGFLLTNDAKTISVTNDSGSTAISAGDVCYCIAVDNKFGSTTTEASIKSLYAASDVLVKSGTISATAYKTVIGVALNDIPADGKGTLAMEGLFFNQVSENVEAGYAVQFSEATDNDLSANDPGTTAVYSESFTKIGRALTGGTADKKYILWKLTL